MFEFITEASDNALLLSSNKLSIKCSCTLPESRYATAVAHNKNALKDTNFQNGRHFWQIRIVKASSIENHVRRVMKCIVLFFNVRYIDRNRYGIKFVSL